MPTKLRRRSRYAVAALSVVLGGALSILLRPSWFVGRPAHPQTVAELEASIDRALPLGSSREKVDAWLRTNDFEYSFVEPAAEGAERELPIVEPKGAPGLARGYFQAIQRDTDRSFACTGNIQVKLPIDASGRLLRRSVTWTGTCL